MEIGENVEDQNQKKPATTALHSTQSQPILFGKLDCESSQTSEKDANVRKTSKNRRVSFASSSQLTQYLEPINPFESLVPVSSAEELSKLYRLSCEKHKTTPIPTIIEHLESLNLEKSLSNERTEILNLKQQTLSHESCEALEELFKRVKYRSIDLTSCQLDDISATSLFDMIEYYEACNELNISENSNIKNRGWLSCINMIKRSHALHNLSTRGTQISDSNASALGNALMSSYIYTLKLEHCGLAGRPILCLSSALHKNRILKELCLANNELTTNDAFHIGNTLKNNYHLQLLDISNNDIQDEGFRHIAEALGYQSIHVSKTSSADSLSSSSVNKFDFNDFTTNLNNINNNRNRFSPTPPPKIDNSVHVRNENSSTLNINSNNNNNNNNNNNSILQCDNDSSKPNESSDVKQQQQQQQQQLQQQQPQSIKTKNENDANVNVGTNESGVGATSTSTNSIDEESSVSTNSKFKYTTESLSPISHGYDDTTTNHQIFNSRSPERSFSSESLCSETSVESNDSKSSIRLIESKFRNGTLERQSHNVATNTLVSGEKQATGLQVLILWNNNLTSACAASAADLFECTEYLQIINFGQNQIGNEFLKDTKSTLKTNESIISIGMQATNITCEGLKMFAEILQFGGNSTLQRIDLRNNTLLIPGLNALSDALKSNKTIIRIDLDDVPKNEMLPIYEKNSEYQRVISTIRQQCLYNENPPEPLEIPKATTTVQRIKRTSFGTRKISLTCSSVKVAPKQQLLEPIKKQANNRLRSPSPTLSPSSPLTSPSRSSRFQVSRVSESSSGISSKSPSSNSSPTFFPSNSRFRVITISEPSKKIESIPPPIPLKVSELKCEASKEFDIQAPIIHSKPFIDVANPSITSSQSCEQLDYEVKRFIDLDSCSSFSSSIDSIDRQTDVSSTDSFDIVVEKPSTEIVKSLNDEFDDKKDMLSNENTLTVSTSSSSSSNEGLTLTTNSPTELSPKQESQKRARKTSWIQSAISGGNTNKNNENTSSNYPATLDKLLNLFHHPASIFTNKTSPETAAATTASSPSSSKPKLKDEKQQQAGMGQKENSISGFIHSFLMKKDEKVTSNESSSILQNISPENTIGKNNSNPQMILESLPKNIKKELKENISPENTVSLQNCENCENFAEIEKSKTSPLGQKVLFVVGDDGSLDGLSDEMLSINIDDSASESSSNICFESHSLGDIARDSMTILKSPNDVLEE